jgi:FtsP/CotA-like multicopper oxidase with cupredoxin domain
MRATNMKKAITMTRIATLLTIALALFVTATAYAAAPGITGPTFRLVAGPGALTQPDGGMVYSWGYGCNAAPASLAPATIAGACPNGQMQLPGPTLIVTEGQTVTLTLTNIAAAQSTPTTLETARLRSRRAS